MTDFRVTLSNGGTTITFNSRNGFSGDGFVVTKEEISGLWSTPASKVTLTERQTGNGAHDVSKGMILYAARTVTIPFGIRGDSHAKLQYARNLLGLMLGDIITMTIHDGGEVTYLNGYAVNSFSDVYDELTDTGEITLTCPNPVRQSVNAHQYSLQPLSSGSGGLYYGASGKGLVYDVQYGKFAADARNACVAENLGNTVAYPVITVVGTFPNGVQIMWNLPDGTSNSIFYNSPIINQTLILDCSDRTATIGGGDMSRNLIRRGFPYVNPKSSANIQLMSNGNGWATITLRDAYL